MKKVKEIRNKSKRKQRQNISTKVRDCVSSQISFSLRRLNSGKTFRSYDILPYSVEDLKLHLERLFTDGMSWDNYGQQGWHIDHIKPVCSFNLVNKDGTPNYEEIKKCWALDNLQPLWAKDNVAKSSIFEENGILYKYDRFGNKTVIKK